AQLELGNGTLTQRLLTNRGSASWAAGWCLTLISGATIGNGGTWTDHGANTLSGNGQFGNIGTVEEPAGTADSSYRVPFSNAGTVNVHGGALSLAQGGAVGSAGSFMIDAGAQLTFAAGAF